MESPDDRADRLASIAAQLAGRVRDDNPDANARWLESITDERDRWELLFVQAAAIPADVKWSILTAWTRGERELKPCGTAAAAARHRYHKEPLCGLCRAWERTSRKRPAA